jgi:hypothetical protein
MVGRMPPDLTQTRETGPDVEALTTAVAAAVADAMTVLSSPRIRGPFPHPSAAELARPAYLLELSNWAVAAVSRSRRTLGPRRTRQALDAASHLKLAADLLARLEGVPSAAAAQAIASAARSDVDALRRWRPEPVKAASLGSNLLDLSGWFGELIRAAQRS